MSTFAVFGMTIDVATAEARKKTSGTRKNLKAPGGVEPIPEPEWLELVRKRAEKIMGGATVRQLSPMFDAPQYAEQFMELARKAGKSRNIRIRTKRTFLNADGSRLLTRRPKRQGLALLNGFQNKKPKQ